MRTKLLALFIALGMMGVASAQQSVQVTIENLQPSDGFYATPFWVGFHDGSFDLFDAGATSSAGLEALAEGGDVAGVMSDFTAAAAGQQGVVTSPGGFAGAPVFDPGETATQTFNLAAGERFFSFASMVIPSNDNFFGNDNETAYEILDSNGDFTGELVIDLGFGNVWDSGTEVNDGQGAAFSTAGGTSTDENGVVNLLAADGLNYLDGIGTADGTNINFANASASPLFRVTISAVPEPSAFAAIGLMGLVGFVRRKRA